MVLVEIYIRVSLSKTINPHYFIFRLYFLGIYALLSQRNFVLLVVVDGGHLFHKANEDRDCVAREVFTCVPVTQLET